METNKPWQHMLRARAVHYIYAVVLAASNDASLYDLRRLLDDAIKAVDDALARDGA